MSTDYVRPSSLSEALGLMTQHNLLPLAGGTDIYPAWANGSLVQPVLDVTAIREFGAEPFRMDDKWIIPPLVTWTTVTESTLPPQFAGLQGAAREVGGRQIQNRGTVVGNICNASPAADGVTALMALDAKVRLSSCRGERTVDLAGFIVGNRKTLRAADELVTAIEVPAWGEASAGAFRKLGARRYLVISIAMVAATLELDELGRISRAAIAVGSCAATSVRMGKLEAALIGRPVGETYEIAGLLEGMSPIDDVRATATFRLAAVEQLVGEALAQCSGSLRGDLS